MPDDNGTEATRSDAPSADESLFGEAADDTETAVADEQDADEESAQNPQGSDDAEEQAGQPEDLKVVVSIRGGKATIGVQRPSSDPHIESFDAPDLTGLTQEVPAVVERARAKWEEERKHPAHEPAACCRQQAVETRTSVQAPEPAWAGLGAGRGRRGRCGAAATRDAAAVLREPVGAGR